MREKEEELVCIRYMNGSDSSCFTVVVWLVFPRFGQGKLLLQHDGVSAGFQAGLYVRISQSNGGGVRRNNWYV